MTAKPLDSSATFFLVHFR